MVAAFAKHMRPWPPQVPYKQAEHELITHLSSDQQPSGKANGIEREKEFKENMAFKNWASEPVRGMTCARSQLLAVSVGT
eukprot:1344501-Amorphochlora_amoeboformis.AAC.2